MALAVLVRQVKYWYTTKMWAAIKDNIVLDYYIGIPYQEMVEDAENRGFTHLVEMTIENSPAYLNGQWDGKIFTR